MSNFKSTQREINADAVTSKNLWKNKMQSSFQSLELGGGCENRGVGVPP